MLSALDVIHTHTSEPLLAEILVLQLVLVERFGELFSMELEQGIHRDMV